MEEQVHLNLNTYKNLISSLKELKLDNMANYLEKNVIDTNCNSGVENNKIERADTPSTENTDCISLDTSDDDDNDLSREDNFYTKLQVVKKPLSINVKKATKFRDRSEIKQHIGVYPMRSNPRGLVLIIANNLYKKQKHRRPSAKHDEANLKKLFEEMGFKVITYFDLPGQEIEQRIKEFSEMPELRRVDSAFVIISSHGEGRIGHQETEILGIDYKKVVCTKIMNYFTAENCRNLLGKPKIFIFQSCRGKNEQVVVPRHTTDAATTSKPRTEKNYIHFSDTMRNYEDMLIVYATIPGYVSYRDNYNGSWFIQILCEVFMNYAHKIPVQELFYMIDYRLKNIRTSDEHCQTPSITSQGFNKYCFLNPGLLDEQQYESNGTNEKTDVTFQCCPDRRANIFVCSHCESIYHHKCAKKLNNVIIVDNVRVDCCSLNRNNDDNKEFDNRSLSENVEELKKVLYNLKDENINLKEQVSTLDAQHINIISNEIVSKSFEQNLKIENLTNENQLLKQLNQEMKDNNKLLREKNDWLSNRMNKKKKNQWVKNNLRKVLKKKPRKRSNTIEPVEVQI